MEGLRQQIARDTALYSAAIVLCSYLVGTMGWSKAVLLVLVYWTWRHMNAQMDQMEDTLWERRFSPSKHDFADTESSDIDSSACDSSMDSFEHSMGERQEVAVLNMMIDCAWPQIALHLEQRMYKTVKDALVMQMNDKSWINFLKLRYLRFDMDQGRPQVEEIRSFQHGWRNRRDTIIVDAKVRFEGLLRIGIQVGLVVGTWNITANVTTIRCILRHTFREPITSPPFMKLCTVEVIEEPQLKFSVSVGSFDPAKIPAIEHYLKGNLVRKLKSTVWNFVFTGKDPFTNESSLLPSRLPSTEREPSTSVSPNVRSRRQSAADASIKSNSAGGIFHTYIEGIGHIDICGSDAKTKSIESLQITLTLGQSELVSSPSKDGRFEEAISFLVPQEELYTLFQPSHDDHVKYAWSLRIKVLCEYVNTSGKVKSTTFKGSINIVKLLGVDLRSNIVQKATLRLEPKNGGMLHLRFLWEPLLTIYEYHHRVVAPIIPLWHTMTEEQHTPFGAIQIQFLRLDSFSHDPALVHPYALFRFGEESSACSKVFKSKIIYSYTEETVHFATEEFVVLGSGSPSEHLSVSVFNHNSKPRELLYTTAIDLWSQMGTLETLAWTASYTLTAASEEQSPCTAVLSFSLSPTTYFYARAKQHLFRDRSAVVI